MAQFDVYDDIETRSVGKQSLTQMEVNSHGAFRDGVAASS